MVNSRRQMGQRALPKVPRTESDHQALRDAETKRAQKNAKRLTKSNMEVVRVERR